MLTTELITYLDKYLAHDQYPHDTSANGLQVDSSKKEIKKIGYAVDVTSYLIDKAIEAEVDMMLTHHGMFWGYEQTITGITYTRIKKLLDHDIALYSSHLPLDAHPEVGNNAGLIQAWKNIFALGDTVTIEPFGDYKGDTIGFVLHSESSIPVAAVLSPYAENMQLVKEFYNFGNKETISSIAIVSGGGGSVLEEANKKNIDLFITGEMVHYQLTLAKELGQSVLLGGHYETEKIGIKLLCHHLIKQFDGLTCIYLDEKY